MTRRPRRWLSVLWLGGGLLALTVLWVPVDSVMLSFSGPSRVTTHWGLLSPVKVDRRYNPMRFGTSLGARKVEPPAPKPGEIIWDHRGEFGTDVVILTVLEHTVIIDYVTLSASVLVTLLVLWSAVVLPIRRVIQSFRSLQEALLPKAPECSPCV